MHDDDLRTRLRDLPGAAPQLGLADVQRRGNNRRNARRTAAGLGVAALALAGVFVATRVPWSETPPPPVAGTPTAVPSVAPPPTTVPTASPATATAAPTTSEPTAPATQASGPGTTTMTSPAPATTAAPPAPSATRAPASSPTSSPPPAGAPVNAVDYLGTGGMGEGYYWTSPSGNLVCGLDVSGAAGTNPTGPAGVGCQARVVVQNTACGDDPNARSTLVQLTQEGSSVTQCTTQGVYVADPGTPAKALPYGSTIQAWRYECTSTPQGMSCRDLGTGHWFLLAKEGVTLG